MIGEQVPFVFVPRYTSVMGAQDFVSSALDMTPYVSGAVTIWRGQLLGATPTFKLWLQGSTDTNTWVDLELRHPPDPAWIDPGQDTAVSVGLGWLGYRYIRAKIELGGTDPAVTCWATGLVTERVE